VIGKPLTSYEVIRQQLLPLPGLQAAVNVALLDILGKKAKAQIYQVLGGPDAIQGSRQCRFGRRDG
jgi:L-alanine-DL-glutamate epimerase-like enolase superfamily enzyme